MSRTYLFNTNKIKYIKENRLKKKKSFDCTLCAIKNGHPDVEALELFRSELMVITVNLYPFNPGHLMIFPQRHVREYEDLTVDEALELFKLTQISIKILKDEFCPEGFNIGFNLGQGSGASISHLHQHIVPRYQNEVGYLDVLAGSRVVVVDPHETLLRLKHHFAEIEI